MEKKVAVFDEEIGNCVNEKDRAHVFDFSKFEIIAIDDFHSVINGSWKFKGDIEAPWDMTLYTERFERG